MLELWGLRSTPSLSSLPGSLLLRMEAPDRVLSMGQIELTLSLCYVESLEIKHVGHCWRSRDELISDVLLWTPWHVRAKAGRPARPCIQQLCEDTGCSPEDLAEAMSRRERWRERVRDIRADGMTWWWYIYIYIYGPVKVKLATLVKADPKAPFSLRCRGGRYSIPWISLL